MSLRLDGFLTSFFFFFFILLNLFLFSCSPLGEGKTLGGRAWCQLLFVGFFIFTVRSLSLCLAVRAGWVSCMHVHDDDDGAQFQSGCWRREGRALLVAGGGEGEPRCLLLLRQGRHGLGFHLHLRVFDGPILAERGHAHHPPRDCLPAHGGVW